MGELEQLQSERRLREANENARRIEREQRTREHQLRVARYKHHKALTAAASPHPLNIHAIGDSWFDYPADGNIPVPLSNFGIVADSQLVAKGSPNPNILNRAAAGQASTVVMNWENQSTTVNDWIDGSNWTNGNLDAFLVSMGGDDIVGDPLAIYLTYGGGTRAVSARFKGVLELVKSSYLDLFEMRNLFAPGVPVFGHCYDYALPNGIPAATILGPWLQPSFKFAHYDFSDAQHVVRDMIDQFHDMLFALQSDPRNRFYLIDTRITMNPDNVAPNGWANELHPYPHGFSLLADKFLAELRSHFSGRI